jgi:hypothetical protein
MTIHLHHHHLQSDPIDPHLFMMMIMMMIHQIDLGIKDPLHHPISTHMLPLHHDHPLTEKISMGLDLCLHQPIGIVHVKEKVGYSAVHCCMLQVCDDVANFT